MNTATMEHLNTSFPANPATVREGFATQRAAGLRAKDAAEALGLSEGAVIQAHTGAHDRSLQSTPLVGGQWKKRGQGLELVIVENSQATMIPVQDKLDLLS